MVKNVRILLIAWIISILQWKLPEIRDGRRNACKCIINKIYFPQICNTKKRAVLYLCIVKQLWRAGLLVFAACLRTHEFSDNRQSPLGTERHARSWHDFISLSLVKNTVSILFARKNSNVDHEISSKSHKHKNSIYK